EKPAAHLTGRSSRESENGTLQWEHTKGLAFWRDLRYQGRALVCSKPGYYYVYSRLYLWMHGCPGSQTNPFFTHSVYKKTPRYPEEMLVLSNTLPYCDRADEGTWSRNSFLGGIVHLEEKDQLYVKAMPSSLVRVKDGTRTYFGAFMI
uniref:TNF superfamily member 14 n=1 Tax=Sphenodon punctatus TaxID=8508 RepID=A0A8D0GT06_SPHPU